MEDNNKSMREEVDKNVEERITTVQKEISETHPTHQEVQHIQEDLQVRIENVKDNSTALHESLQKEVQEEGVRVQARFEEVSTNIHTCLLYTSRCV